MANRAGVLPGGEIELRMVFTDDLGNFVDTDALPVVYIYDPSIDSVTIEEEIEAQTYTSALAGPLTSTQLGTGFYQLTYTVPGGAEEGSWTDVWVGDLEGTSSADSFIFRVQVGANLEDQRLLNNELVIIELDESITSLDGLSALGEDQQVSFTTTFVPLYASPDLVRLEIGPWIDFIPDNTLALMLYWSSREADFILGARPKSSDRLSFARTKFVVFDAALRTLYLPSSTGSSLGASSSGGSKKLGDLSITSGGSVGATLSSGIDLETVRYIRGQRDEWSRVVNAGGNIVPGQGFAPSVAIRAKYDPDRRNSGRLWLDPNEYHYAQPGVNYKSYAHGGSRGRGHFTDGLGGSNGITTIALI